MTTTPQGTTIAHPTVSSTTVVDLRVSSPGESEPRPGFTVVPAAPPGIDSSSIFLRPQPADEPASALRVIPSAPPPPSVGPATSPAPIASTVPGLRWQSDRKTWRLDYGDERGNRRRKDLGPDQELAERAARDELDLVRRMQAGSVSPTIRAALRPLADHMADFCRWLDNGERTKHHVEFSTRVLYDYVAAIGGKKLEDLSSTSAVQWLKGLKDEAKTAKYGEKGLSASSLNHRIRALRQFGRWLVDERRIALSPFTTLKKFNEAADRRRVRRALTPEQFRMLLEAAYERPLREEKKPRSIRGRMVEPDLSPAQVERCRLRGEARVIFYSLAYWSGMRRDELESLSWAQVDLKGGVIDLMPGEQKARAERPPVILSTALTNMLHGWRAKRTGDLVFGGDTEDARGLAPTIRTLKEDLAAAKIAYTDGRGRTVDLHAGRKTMSTELQRNGVPVADAQQLLRHADAETTLKHYSEPADVEGLRAALDGLDFMPAGLVERLAGDSSRRLLCQASGGSVSGTGSCGTTRKDFRPAGVLVGAEDVAGQRPEDWPVNGESPVVSDGAPRYARRDSNAQPLAPERLQDVENTTVTPGACGEPSTVGPEHPGRIRVQTPGGIREVRVPAPSAGPDDGVDVVRLSRELLAVALRHPDAAPQLMGAAHLLLKLASRKGSEPAVAPAGSEQIDHPPVPRKAATYAL